MGSSCPLIILAVIFALGVVAEQRDVAVALMAAVPMLAAVFAAVSLHGSGRRGCPFVAGLVLTFLPGEGELSDNVVPLVALIVLAAVAVIAGHYRQHKRLSSPCPGGQGRVMQFQLQTQADTDSMTGLLNRRGAIRALGPRNTAGDRVVAFLDCDLFKNVNEQYGSDVGDEFLQAIAGRLRHALPAPRHGGPLGRRRVPGRGGGRRRDGCSPALERVVAFDQRPPPSARHRARSRRPCRWVPPSGAPDRSSRTSSRALAALSTAPDEWTGADNRRHRPAGPRSPSPRP